MKTCHIFTLTEDIEIYHEILLTKFHENLALPKGIDSIFKSISDYCFRLPVFSQSKKFIRYSTYAQLIYFRTKLTVLFEPRDGRVWNRDFFAVHMCRCPMVFELKTLRCSSSEQFTSQRLKDMKTWFFTFIALL